MQKGIRLIVLSAVCVSVGQLLWKLGVDGDLLYVLTGFMFYGTGAFLMVMAFKYGEVSVLQPFISLSYIMAIAFGYFILHETITYGKVIGVILIITGVIFLSRESNS